MRTPALQAFDLAVALTAWWGSSASDLFMEGKEIQGDGQNMRAARESMRHMPAVYWVNSDMTQIIDTARQSLEPTPAVQEVPAPGGFVQFARPLDGPIEPAPQGM